MVSHINSMSILFNQGIIEPQTFALFIKTVEQLLKNSELKNLENIQTITMTSPMQLTKNESVFNKYVY